MPGEALSRQHRSDWIATPPIGWKGGLAMTGFGERPRQVLYRHREPKAWRSSMAPLVPSPSELMTVWKLGRARALTPNWIHVLQEEAKPPLWVWLGRSSCSDAYAGRGRLPAAPQRLDGH